MCTPEFHLRRPFPNVVPCLASYHSASGFISASALRLAPQSSLRLMPTAMQKTLLDVQCGTVFLPFRHHLTGGSTPALAFPPCLRSFSPLSAQPSLSQADPIHPTHHTFQPTHTLLCKAHTAVITDNPNAVRKTTEIELENTTQQYQWRMEQTPVKNCLSSFLLACA
jgi:hypothetical protein